MRIIERRGVQESIQGLQAQTWKKHGGFGKFKGKNDKGNNNKGFKTHSQKLNNDEKYESSKREGWTSNHKETFDKKVVQCYNCEKWGHMAKD